jgi:hypothetical protein
LKVLCETDADTRANNVEEKDNRDLLDVNNN